MGDRAALGHWGEHLAAGYLERSGLTVVARNWRCRRGDVRGEVDIVAWEGPVLVFCEVKSRRGMGAGGPLAAVDGRKQARLRKLAVAYLAETASRAGEVRFDVVGLTWSDPRQVPVIEHVRGVGW